MNQDWGYRVNETDMVSLPGAYINQVSTQLITILITAMKGRG